MARMASGSHAKRAAPLGAALLLSQAYLLGRCQIVSSELDARHFGLD